MGILELRDGDEAAGWLSAGLTLVRLPSASADALESASAWVVATLSEAAALPPVGVVTDLGRVALVASSSQVARALPAGHPRLRSAISAYEDQMLGRLAADPLLDAVSDALHRIPAPLLPPAVALLVGHVLERAGFEEGVSLSAGVARRSLSRPSEEILEEGLARLRGTGRIPTLLAEGYEALAHRARQAETLLTEALVFALENFSALSSLSQRLALEQAAEAAGELAARLPRRIARRRPPTGHTTTRIEDESAYPAGGFAALSTSGSFENLVASELMYMNPPARAGACGVAAEAEAEAEVDLFDVRFAEGELLFYTRDETLHVRERRVVTFALLPDLVHARFKDEAIRFQRLVYALGLVLCLARRLVEWLSAEELLIRIVGLDGPGDEGRGDAPLAAELDLSRLLLGEWIEKGVAEVARAADLDAVLASAVDASRRARSDLVLVTAGSPKPPRHPRVRAAVLSLAAASPTLRLSDDRPRPTGPEPPSPGEAWIEAARTLLVELA
jgi:hypothetical protein